MPICSNEPSALSSMASMNSGLSDENSPKALSISSRMSSSTEGPPHALRSTVQATAMAISGIAQNLFFIPTSKRWNTRPSERSGAQRPHYLDNR